jgi:hypothetical protein
VLLINAGLRVVTSKAIATTSEPPPQ